MDRDLYDRAVNAVGRLGEDEIRRQAVRAALPLIVSAWPADEQAGIGDALQAPYQPFYPGSPWGRPWTDTWFRLDGILPQDWAGGHVEATVDLGFSPKWLGHHAEGLVFGSRGELVKGLFPGAEDLRADHRVLDGNQVRFYVQAAALPLIPTQPSDLGDEETATSQPLYRFRYAMLRLLDDTVTGLQDDLALACDLIRQLPDNHPWRQVAGRALLEALALLDPRGIPAGADAARKRLAVIYSQQPAEPAPHTIATVGHVHLDAAWLWPVAESRRKAVRIFSHLLSMAGEYPELVIACSQAQVFAWLQEDEPELFGLVRAKVAEGVIAPTGGMWVEADVNIPSGESVLRQMTFGVRYFQRELGRRVREVWLPDTFGFPASLPQIAAVAGLRYFFTQKLSWNEFSVHPYTTFEWEGIDGSKVLVHFSPADTYSGTLSAEEILRTARRHRESHGAARSLTPIGWAGTGPTRGVMERYRRLRAMPEIARLEMQCPADFFAQLHDAPPGRPVWRGELYLETHRGTFTSQQDVKAGNRRCELLLHDAEYWCTAAAVSAARRYPQERLEEAWRMLLLHQAHDIVTGTSIAWVNRDALAAYKKISSGLEELVSQALEAISGVGSDHLLVNSGPSPVDGVVTVAADQAAHGGPPEGAQGLTDGRWVLPVRLGPYSIGRLSQATAALSPPVRTDGMAIDNGLLRIALSDRGNICSILDLEVGREIIPPLRECRVLLYPDLPTTHDAWNLDAYYERQPPADGQLVSMRVLEDGPLLSAIEVVQAIGGSTVTQVLALRCGVKALDIDTLINWNESDHVIRAIFPLDIHPSNETARTQFGYVTREAHRNTARDAARFESLTQGWIHIAESSYGVSLVTPTLYGYNVRRRPCAGRVAAEIGLSLLRSSRMPDARAERGPHRHRYCLLPGSTVQDAVSFYYQEAHPPRLIRGARPAGPLVSLSGSGVVLETVKTADDCSGDVIARFYESLGARSEAVAQTSFPVRRACLTDALEVPQDSSRLGRTGPDEFTLPLRPFEIATIRFARDADKSAAREAGRA